MRVLSALLGCSMLAGCASMDVNQVDANGQRIPGTMSGLYVPREMPFLYVQALPSEEATGAADKPGAAAPLPPSSATDYSFVAGNTRYVVKLVQMADWSHTQAIKVTGGIFGVGNMSVNLQPNGGLSSVSMGTDDSKVLDAAVSALAGGSKTASTSGAAKVISAAKKVSAGQDVPPIKPGWYRLVYSASGSFMGMQYMPELPPS